MVATVNVWRKHVIILVVLFIFNILLFGETLKHPFMMDDYGVLKQSSQPVNTQSILNCVFPKNDSLVYYRPITDISLILYVNLTSGNAVYCRMVNIILFTLFVWLLYLFTHRLLENAQIALFSAVLWASHPINGFYVNYITAHEIVLWGIWMFAALAAYLSFIQNSKKTWLCFSVVFFVLALGMQEMSALMPVYIFLINRFKRRSWMDSFQKASIFLAVVVVWIIIRKLMIPVTNDTPYMIKEGMHWMGLDASNYLPNMMILIGWYISQLFVPFEILFMKSLWPVSSNGLGLSIVSLVVLLVIFLLITAIRKVTVRWTIVWFLVGFIPLSVAALIYPAEGLVIEPHWFLVNSWGFFWLLAICCWELKMKFNSRIIMTGFLCLIMFWTFLTAIYNDRWRSQESYCSYWLSIEPQHHLPNFWLGMDYLEKGQFKEAEFLFRKSITGWYIDWEVFINLGAIASREKRFDEAIDWYNKALKLNPSAVEAYNNLGVIHFEQKNFGIARNYFAKALEVDPGFINATRNLKLIDGNQINDRNADLKESE